MKYFEWLLSGLSLITLWLMGNKYKYAPLFGLFNQALWIIFVINTKQYGLLVGVLGFAIIHIRNLIKWKKEINDRKRTV